MGIDVLEIQQELRLRGLTQIDNNSDISQIIGDTSEKVSCIFFVPHGKFKEKIFPIDLAQVLLPIAENTGDYLVNNPHILFSKERAIRNDGRHVNFKAQTITGTNRLFLKPITNKFGSIIRNQGNPGYTNQDGTFHWGVTPSQGTLWIPGNL